MPLQMFVHPVLPDAVVPPIFEKFAVVPDDPLTLDPELIGENRDQWIKEWTDIVIR
jgi:thiamine transport system substrate-binding protein